MPAYENLEVGLIKAIRSLEAEGYRGYDPYDALLSPIAKILPGPKARLLFTHAIRKIPFNIRPLLGIGKTLNPKTLALSLSVYSVLREKERANEVISLLERTFPWGYPFPWQSRAFFVPAGTPTAVNTAFVLHALMDAGEELGLDTKCLVQKGAENILSCLNRSPDGFFSYTPLDNYRIHNANLLLASALARVGFREEAISAAGASLKLQRPNGSWPYGEGQRMFSYIDNFHTGFVILALSLLRRTLGEEFAEPLERAVDFYERNLFGPRGLPLWRVGKRYPLDVHVLAVAAGVMAELGKTERALELALSLIGFFMDRRGRFGYQRGRFIYNRTRYTRWGQAWGAWALAKVIKQKRQP
jgi:hypothetical protein